MSIKTTFPFDDPNNYTFDLALIDFTALQKPRLKNQIPADITFGAKYDIHIDGNLGGGVLAGTPFGGAAVSGGKLDLAHNDLRYVDYDADLNADSQQRGCLTVKITPNWTANPATDKSLFVISDGHTLTKNAILLRIKTDDYVQLYMSDENGNIIINETLGQFGSHTGVSREVEINWDWDIGETRVFIHGDQCGATQASTGTRSTNINLLRMGSNFAGVDTSNFAVEDLIIFDEVQHTADYTPGYTVPTKYSLLNPTVEVNTPILHEGLEGFSVTDVVTGSDELSYTLKKDCTDYYWNGSEWVVSDGTYAQSNSAAEIVANMATFTTSPVCTRTKIYFHSDDGSTTPEITSLELQTNYAGELPDNISFCVVTGYLKECKEGETEDRTVKVYLANTSVKYKDNITLLSEHYVIELECNGKWEIALAENENMTGDQYYVFVIDGVEYHKIIKNIATAEFYDLEDHV